MKAHSVKSNAKRAARKLAERFPELEPLDPRPMDGGWFAVARVDAIPAPGLADAASGLVVLEAPDLFAKMLREQTGDLAPVPHDMAALAAEAASTAEAANVPAEGSTFLSVRMGLLTEDEARAEFGTPAEPVPVEPIAQLVTTGAPAQPEPPARPVPGKDEPTAPKPRMTTEQIAKAAAALPPRKEYTREELDQLRAERRARIAARQEPAFQMDATPRRAKVVDAKPRKPVRADTIIELTSRADGATVQELMDATGWQAHTLRGYIAGTLRKRGHVIQSRKVKGEPTRYIIEAASAD